MIKKLAKYGKIVMAATLIMALALPSYATLGASDGSAFVTKAEFDAALADFNARLTTFEAGINSKIDSQVSSYLDRNGIWSGKEQGVDQSFSIQSMTVTSENNKDRAYGSDFAHIYYNQNILAGTEHLVITKSGMLNFKVQSTKVGNGYWYDRTYLKNNYNGFAYCSGGIDFILYNATSAGKKDYKDGSTYEVKWKQHVADKQVSVAASGRDIGGNTQYGVPETANPDFMGGATTGYRWGLWVWSGGTTYNNFTFVNKGEKLSFCVDVSTDAGSNSNIQGCGGISFSNLTNLGLKFYDFVVY